MQSITEDNKQQVLSASSLAIRKCIAGGLSSMTISSLLNPVDLIKTRLQTASANSSSSANGFIACSRNIIQQEGGLLAMWKVGLAVTATRSLCYSGLRLGLYEPVRDVTSSLILSNNNQSDQDAGLIIKAISGFSTGMLGAAIVNPLDLVKIRLQSVNNAVQKQTIIQTFSDIIRTEGIIKGLYKGTSVTCIRAAFLTAAQMSSYDHSKYLLTTHFPTVFDREFFGTHVLCAVIASVVTTFTYAPLDTVKTRYMNDRAANKQYNGVVDCLIKIGKNEGVRGLYRGAFANLTRLAPHFVLSFPLYEAIRKELGVPAL
jgi:hypothetical protein